MRGYGRPGPEFTWYCWWGAMLIANDDVPTEEELRAEDEAIAAAERGAPLVPGDMTHLLEVLGGRQDEDADVAQPDRGDGRGSA